MMPDTLGSAPAAGGTWRMSSATGEVHVLHDDDGTHVVLVGEIDADMQEDLRQAQADAVHAGRPVRIDAQHVTFIDSAGVGFIARLAVASPVRVRLMAASTPVRRLVEITGLGALVDVVPAPRDGSPDSIG